MYAKGAIQMSPLIFVQMKREYDSQLENHTLVIIFSCVLFNHYLPREIRKYAMELLTQT